MKITDKLTVDEAMAGGYLHFGIADIYDQPGCFRSLGLQELIEAQHEYPDSDMVLFDPTPNYLGGISENDLRELITETMCCRFYDEVGGDDDSEVTEKLKGLDYKTLSDAIGVAMLSTQPFYEWTSIKVIPNPA